MQHAHAACHSRRRARGALRRTSGRAPAAPTTRPPRTAPTASAASAAADLRLRTQTVPRATCMARTEYGCFGRVCAGCWACLAGDCFGSISNGCRGRLADGRLDLRPQLEGPKKWHVAFLVARSVVPGASFSFVFDQGLIWSSQDLFFGWGLVAGMPYALMQQPILAHGGFMPCHAWHCSARCPSQAPT